MLRLISDEDVHGDVLRGLWRRAPDLDLVRAMDVGLSRTPDPVVLEWAARENRILITQDRSTLVGSAWARVKAGEPMPGVLAMRPHATIGQVIEDILLVAACETEDGMRNQVKFIPL